MRIFSFTRREKREERGTGELQKTSVHGRDETKARGATKGDTTDRLANKNALESQLNAARRREGPLQ